MSNPQGFEFILQKETCLCSPYGLSALSCSHQTPFKLTCWKIMLHFGCVLCFHFVISKCSTHKNKVDRVPVIQVIIALSVLDGKTPSSSFLSSPNSLRLCTQRCLLPADFRLEDFLDQIACLGELIFLYKLILWGTGFCSFKQIDFMYF